MPDAEMAGPSHAAGDVSLALRAPAKVNLTLHVIGRRPDGYHELESLVAFAGAADRLTLLPGEGLSLHVEGPTARHAGPIEDNLVLRAARALADRRPGLRLGAFRLTKRLPAAAGIGGGSSDAAGALRLIARLNGLSENDDQVTAAAVATGADIPVCLQPSGRMMGGAGEVVGPTLGLPPLAAVLVNPRIAVATADVFRALGLRAGEKRDGPPHPSLAPDFLTRAALLTLLAAARNDLETPALSLAPVIGQALDLLRGEKGCELARMSGSGATVFGIFGDCRSAARAARAIRRVHPDWWVRPTVLS